MKHIKRFKTELEYISFNSSVDYATPNISVVEETNKNYYDKKEPIQTCDIAYWNGSAVLTTKYDRWNSSLGTPIGVVVIPESFLPDGKCRIVGLNRAIDGNYNYGSKNMMWSDTLTDTNIYNYGHIVNTSNQDLNSDITSQISESIVSWFPSDSYTGVKSFIDREAKYSNSATKYIPSPYNGKVFNTEYIKPLSGRNLLSDVNGLSNTQILVQLGNSYKAANAAWNYNDGGSNLQWYLPTAAEFGFVIARLKHINEIIALLNGEIIATGINYWLSNESSTNLAFCAGPTSGGIRSINKDYANYVTPFAII